MRFKSTNWVYPSLIIGSATISSIGSWIWLLAQLSFFLANAYTLTEISLFVGFTRAATIISTFLAGYYSDAIAEKNLVLSCELVAAISSLGLLLTYDDKTLFYLFILIASVRSFSVALQTGGRVKMFKSLAQNKNEKTFSIFSTISTHAPIFVAAVVIVSPLGQLSLNNFIILDFISFLLSGALLVLVPSSKLNERHKRQRFTEFIHDLYDYAPKWAFVDLLLAFSLCGLVMLMVRVAGGSELLPYFYMTYGFSVILSGWLYAKLSTFAKPATSVIFIVVGFCLLALLKNGMIVLFSSFLVLTLGYWTLFHIISAKIQISSPISKSAGIQAARNMQMLVILVAGELATGLIVDLVSWEQEMFIRAGLASSIFFALRYFKNEKSTNSGS